MCTYCKDSEGHANNCPMVAERHIAASSNWLEGYGRGYRGEKILWVALMFHSQYYCDGYKQGLVDYRQELLELQELQKLQMGASVLRN